MPFDFIPPNTTLTHLKTHPLDGVTERLDRADENISHLKKTLIDSRDENPQVFSTHFDPTTGDFSYQAKRVKNPGLRVAVLAGEILFLLRSSLDHVIAQWLIPRTPANEIDDVLSRSGFPIFDDSRGWSSFDWTKIPRATHELRTAITKCQPCNRTDGLSPSDHPLAVLADMNNTDKHRLLLITVVKASVTTVIGPKFRGKTNLIFNGGIVPGSSNVVGHVDAPLITGRVDLASGGEMDVDFQGSTEIAFKQVGTRQGEPIIPTLENLAKFVRELIGEFRVNLF